MRYLALDLGDKRTGLAVGDDETGIVSPVGAIVTASHDERLRRLGTFIADEQPDALVVGLPLNMDGSESVMSKKVAGWAEGLRERFGLPVFTMDERLTSAAADGQMARSGLTHGQKKARRDALAAANILRDFLARLDEGGAC